MIEVMATIMGAIAVSLYVSGLLFILWVFLDERRPLGHVVYLPLILLWPVALAYRLWGLRQGENWECKGPSK